jgi:hypothetical protein
VENSEGLNHEEDFMAERQIITWIAQGQDIKIDVVRKIEKHSKDVICSAF